MTLKFRQLEAFHAVMKAGTVTGAAEILSISQPGVSNLLAQLEAGGGIKFFDRVHGRLAPTPEAEIFFGEVDTLMRGLDRTNQVLADLQSNRLGQLQVASQHSMSFGFMPRLIAQFTADRPDITISFQSQYSDKIQEWVAAGLFEIGICETPLHQDNLNVYPVHIGTVLAVPNGSPLAEYDVLTPRDLQDVPFVVMSRDHPTHRRLQQAFDEAGIALRSRIQSHLFKNLLSFVQQGMGVALVDRFAMEYDASDDVDMRPFEPRIHLEMAVVTTKARQLSRIGQEFLDLVLEEIQVFAAETG